MEGRPGPELTSSGMGEGSCIAQPSAAAGALDGQSGACFTHMQAQEVAQSLGSVLQTPSSQSTCSMQCAAHRDLAFSGLPQNSYPAQLQLLLGPSYAVKNFGRGWSSLMPPLPGSPLAPRHLFWKPTALLEAVAEWVRSHSAPSLQHG